MAPRAFRILLASALLASSACAVAVRTDDQAGPTSIPDTSNADTSGPQRAPLQIVESEAGTLALVPVTIGGEGPYPFALDTGASSSVVDEEIAKELGLELGERRRQVVGVSGEADARRVTIEAWKAGDVTLPSGEFTAIDLPDPQGHAGLAGLLGSDILSTFGHVTVDYDEEVLIFTPRGF